MDAAFVALVDWVIAHGYLLYFLTALIEGPIVTAAAGVAAALGYFSLPFVILISIFGDLIPDSLLYAIGYFGGRPLAEKYGHFLGLTDEHFKQLDAFLKRHIGKTLIFVKFTPIIPIPGIILVGSSGVRFRRFIWTIIAISIPKALFFSLLGFFSGRAYEYMSGTIVSARNATFFLGIALMAIYFIYRTIAKRFAEKAKSI
jgi:membrane protein DedA with SNARE-associated domain